MSASEENYTSFINEILSEAYERLQIVGSRSTHSQALEEQLASFLLSSVIRWAHMKIQRLRSYQMELHLIGQHSDLYHLSRLHLQHIILSCLNGCWGSLGASMCMKFLILIVALSNNTWQVFVEMSSSTGWNVGAASLEHALPIVKLSKLCIPYVGPVKKACWIDCFTTRTMTHNVQTQKARSVYGGLHLLARMLSCSPLQQTSSQMSGCSSTLCQSYELRVLQLQISNDGVFPFLSLGCRHWNLRYVLWHIQISPIKVLCM